MSITYTKEEFIKKVFSLDKGIKVLGDYINTTTKIDFQCEYGHVWKTMPRNILYFNAGCPVCAGKQVLVGFNDLWTTRPDVAELLENKNDGFLYTSGSNKRVNFLCPNCGLIDRKQIYMVSSYGFKCKGCSDGISYPNKFGREFLSQLPIEDFQCEYSPEWAQGRSYDNYFEYNGNKYILEMDGLFHYKDFSCSKLSLDECKEIDKIKNEYAKQHNISVIRIDCKKSNCEYIKQSILQSELNNIFDLSSIDWDLCDSIANKSFVKEVGHLYSSGIHDLNKIKDILHIGISSVQKYVQLAAKFGLCDYTVKRSKQEGRRKIMSPVDIVDDNETIIFHFDGISICIKEMKEIYNINLNSPNIVKACKTGKPYKNINFRYSNKVVECP